jgi:hypothetical protein
MGLFGNDKEQDQSINGLSEKVKQLTYAVAAVGLFALAGLFLPMKKKRR